MAAFVHLIEGAQVAVGEEAETEVGVGGGEFEKGEHPWLNSRWTEPIPCVADDAELAHQPTGMRLGSKGGREMGERGKGLRRGKRWGKAGQAEYGGAVRATAERVA